MISFFLNKIQRYILIDDDDAHINYYNNINKKSLFFFTLIKTVI